MRYDPIDRNLFISNRKRLAEKLLPNSIAVINSNYIMPTNADGTMRFKQNSDLFYLTGIEQEDTTLVLYPDSPNEKLREVLFIKEKNAEIEKWEGYMLSKDDASDISGIEKIDPDNKLEDILYRIIPDSTNIYLNSNEHKRAVIKIDGRDAQFLQYLKNKFPLHNYLRLAPVLQSLRVIKSPIETELIKRACELTAKGYRRVLEFVKPGLMEAEIEAEYAHEFIRNNSYYADYSPIIASGKNACILHYHSNHNECNAGELLLMDVGASYANYNADMTRTIPVNGKYSERQKNVYNAVLRVMRAVIHLMKPGALMKDINTETEKLIEKELVDLKLISLDDIKNAPEGEPVFKRYYYHSVGHFLGLDVHDVGVMHEPLKAGMVLTCEPGIYIKEEGIGVRLENNILLTENGSIDLLASAPVEAEEIEQIMNTK